VIDQNCRSRSRWCRSFYEKLIARSHYLNSGISCGMTDNKKMAQPEKAVKRLSAQPFDCGI
ncbi:hypothetical protein, partial [Aeromonas caviae]|uniref:hypothetical protein n=1 Tax=Aeromonas caviae TaxID=648 RepID=UPI001FC7BCF8